MMAGAGAYRVSGLTRRPPGGSGAFKPPTFIDKK
jgi:hypothetical protein